MENDSAPTKVIRFGPFTADFSSGELWKSGVRLKLRHQSFQVLEELLRRPREVVTREELQKKIWPDNTFVDFDHGLNAAVERLRRALLDSAETPKYIETLPRRGYRFVGEIAASASPSSADLSLPESQPSDSALSPISLTTAAEIVKPPFFKQATLWKAAAVVFATVLIALILAKGRHVPAASAAKPRIRSLAVLPLENLSGDPSQEYFADGMTDELTTMLAKNPSLRVISRTSAMQYKNVHRPLPEIARELGVEGILEGSAGRFGNRVHINVQMIYAATDTHLWAESYERDFSDVGSLQNELAQTIARGVGLTVSPQAPLPRHINPEAHDAYLLGRYKWFGDHLDESQQYFQKAIDLQPDYAAAWSGMADYYLGRAVEGEARPEDVLPLADAAAKKGVQFDDSLAEAHNTLAANYLAHWNVADAERESARALELNPGYAEGHHLRGYVLQALGRADEAVEEQRKAIGLDPFERPWELTYALMRAKHYDAGLAEARMRSQTQPDNADLHDALGSTYEYLHMDKEAVREWETSHRLLGEEAAARAVHNAFQRGGVKAVLEWNLSELRRKASRKYVSPLDVAGFYGCLGRKEETLRYLEESYRQREPFLIRVDSDPTFDFLHSDPRYQAIVKGMGLPVTQGLSQ